MKTERIEIGGIPAVVWGEPSERVYLFVHGKLSDKSSAAQFARIAGEKGFQTISFDLPEHGERTDRDYKCDVWNGAADLRTVADYMDERWKRSSLFACSLGAFFSLHAFRDREFEKALFQSPILDMEHLIRQMFLWFHVTEDELRREGEIPTPVDTLSWKYFTYVREHPIDKWLSPTHILFGGKDNMQTREIMTAFCERFGGALTVSEDSEHPFMTPADGDILERWLRENV